VQGGIAAAYGFRLFETTLRRGDGRKEVPFLVEEDGQVSWRLTEHLMAALSEKLNQKQLGLPHSAGLTEDDVDPEEATRTEARFSLLDLQQRGEHLVFTVRYGRPGGHDLAMSDPSLDEDEDVDISRHAPSRVYRAVLVVPESGTSAVLAVGVIGRACPVRPVVRWFARWSRDWAEAQPAASGQPAASWWKLHPVVLGDNARLDALLRQGDPQRVTLTKWGVTSDNKRASRGMELISYLHCFEATCDRSATARRPRPVLIGRCASACRAWPSRWVAAHGSGTGPCPPRHHF